MFVRVCPAAPYSTCLIDFTKCLVCVRTHTGSPHVRHKTLTHTLSHTLSHTTKQEIARVAAACGQFLLQVLVSAHWCDCFIRLVFNACTDIHNMLDPAISPHTRHLFALDQPSELCLTPFEFRPLSAVQHHGQTDAQHGRITCTCLRPVDSCNQLQLRRVQPLAPTKSRVFR